MFYIMVCTSYKPKKERRRTAEKKKQHKNTQTFPIQWIRKEIPIKKKSPAVKRTANSEQQQKKIVWNLLSFAFISNFAESWNNFDDFDCFWEAEGCARDSFSLIIIQTTWRRNSISHNKVKWMIVTITLACLKKAQLQSFSTSFIEERLEGSKTPTENEKKTTKSGKLIREKRPKIHRVEWMENNKISKIKQNSNSLKNIKLVHFRQFPSIPSYSLWFSLELCGKLFEFELFAVVCS